MMEPSEERKVVTVVFADLVGSTELVSKHDPEQLRVMLSAFFEEMAEQVRAYGGTVEKYAGDAIMAVFGVPRVHEDDAERAVRAAVAMRESLVALNPVFEHDYNAHLELRVGIATGDAVAVTDQRREFLVTGEVANLAARLQSVGGGIVASVETYRLVAPLLETERLENLMLKGFATSVMAFRILGLRTADSDRYGVPGLSSPLVGRDSEMETLRRAVEDLRRGRGRIVTIVGEAGLGKSRLKVELRNNRPPGVRWLEGRCHAYTQSTSYAPLTQVLRTIFRLDDAEPQTIARTKFRATLRALAPSRYDHAHAALAQLLGIPGEPGAAPPPPALDPRSLQAELVVAVRGLLEALAKQEAVILAVEDLHWADAASVELLTALAELTDFHRIMILVATRPDPEGAGWEFRFHAQRNYPHRVVELPLAALGADDSARLAGNILPVADLPEGFQDQILTRAEGNPFFLEEIIRALIEQEVLRREGDRWVAARDPGQLAIPSTLRGVIAARIDRLPALAKRALQRASVVGRWFTYRALQAVYGGNGELDRALAHLLRAELIREWAQAPEREYVFKHALTQEAAYASLLGEERRALHRTVADYLEQTVPDPSGEPATVLAQHWLRAEECERALTYTLQAAERARRLYARPEAVAQYWQALELLDRLPASDERRRTHVDTLLSLVQLPGWMRDDAGRRETLRHLDQALHTVAAAGDLVGLARLKGLKGYLLTDETLLQQAIVHAAEARDATARAYAAEYYAEHLGQSSQYEKSLAHIAEAIEILGTQGERYGQARLMASSGRCYAARAGRLAEALGYAARAREIGAALGDPRLTAWCAMEAEPYLYKGLWEDVVRVAEEALPVAWEIGEWSPIFFASSWLALAYLKLERLEEADRVLRRAMAASRSLRSVRPYWITYLHIALAQRYLAVGEVRLGLEAGAKARDLAEQHGFRLEAGAAHRVLGQGQEGTGKREAADRAFSRSLEILETIQARPELAQTALAYGRFKRLDAPAEGRALAERALRLFEAMEAPGWIREARAALT
jgi:predicted ATPase/class 3 adenylate cyclase